MRDSRSARGIPLPGFWPACVVTAAVAGAWMAWSEFRRGANPPAIAPVEEDGAAKLQSILELSHYGEDGVEKLSAMLLSEEPRTRRNALIALRDMGPVAEGALGEVRARFSDEDWVVRECALQAYLRIIDDPAEKGAVAAGFLADPEKSVRESAFRFLERDGAQVMGSVAVARMAHSESPEARRLVIRLLADVDRLRDSGDVNATVRGLVDDPDPDVRGAAIRSVVMCGGAQIDEVRGWLREDNPSIVHQGLQAICSLGPNAFPALPELEALLEDTNGTRPWPGWELAYINTAARPLIPALLRRAPEARMGVARALAEIGADAAAIAPVLSPLLGADDHNVRYEAGRLLAQTCPEEARREVGRLVGELEASEASIRKSDLDALMGMAPQAKGAVPLLIRLLSHRSEHVPTMAMQTLRDIGPDAAPAVPILLARLDEQADGACIRALGGIGLPARSAVPRLLTLLHNQNRDMLLRDDAVWALGRIGETSPAIIAALRQQLIETKPESGGMGYRGLSRVTALRSLALLAGDAAMTLSDVLPLLDETDVSVRVQAALAIGHLTGDRSESVGPLTRALTDENVYLRSAAALAQGEIGPGARDAVPALHDLRRDCRNAVPNSWRKSPRPTAIYILEFIPRDQDLWRLSVAEAARQALDAIEAPETGPSAGSERSSRKPGAQ